MVEGIHGMAGVAPTQRITKTPEVQAAQTSAQKLDRDKFEMQFQLSKIPPAEQKEIKVFLSIRESPGMVTLRQMT